jgi:hypothetical protein
MRGRMASKASRVSMAPADDLLALLDEAALFVSKYPAVGIYSGHDTGEEFAAEVRALRDRVARQDQSAYGRLVGIFAPTGAWDDGVGGDGSGIANRIMDVLDEMQWQRPTT